MTQTFFFGTTQKKILAVLYYPSDLWELLIFQTITFLIFLYCRGKIIHKFELVFQNQMIPFLLFCYLFYYLKNEQLLTVLTSSQYVNYAFTFLPYQDPIISNSDLSWEDMVSFKQPCTNCIVLI